MFGIGTPELLVILAVALIVIGPKKLPDLAKSLGRALGDFKRATNELKQSLEQESGFDEVRENIRGAKQDALTQVTDRRNEPQTAESEPSSADKPALPAASGNHGDTQAVHDPADPAVSGPDARPTASQPDADDEEKAKE